MAEHIRGNLCSIRLWPSRASGGRVLRGEGKESVVTVIAPGCSIRGFRIEHVGAMLVNEDSGIFLKSDSNRVEHNQLRDVLFGIISSSQATISLMVILSMAVRIWASASGAGHSHLRIPPNNTILQNTITDMRDGMYLQNADRSVIRENRVFGVRYGLHYMYSNDNVFEDNIFENNVAGAAIMYSHNIRSGVTPSFTTAGSAPSGAVPGQPELCLRTESLRRQRRRNLYGGAA